MSKCILVSWIIIIIIADIFINNSLSLYYKIRKYKIFYFGFIRMDMEVGTTKQDIIFSNISHLSFFGLSPR